MRPWEKQNTEAENFTLLVSHLYLLLGASLPSLSAIFHSVDVNRTDWFISGACIKDKNCGSQGILTAWKKKRPLNRILQ